MKDYTPDKELAPRDIVARSIVYEMQKTRSDHVFLDVTHLPPAQVTTRFPHIYRFCMDAGLDITKELIPVAPAAHYLIGGVKVNSWGETNVPGIFAVGEVACTGVHGANRLASNSLLEAIVFGKKIIERTLQTQVQTNTTDTVKADNYCLGESKNLPKAPGISLSNLQSLMWDNVGIIRNGADLRQMADILATWQNTMSIATDRASFELANLIITARLMTEAALIREESRGAHFRTDFPESLPSWEHHIVFKKVD